MKSKIHELKKNNQMVSKLAIIGASAGIGLQTLTQALERGYQVTALSRDTSTIPNDKALTKINGNATSVADIKKTIADADVVIVTVGTKDKKGTTFFSDTATAIIKAVEELEFTKPILFVTGFGTGDSANYLGFFMRTIINLFLKDQYINKTLMDKLIVESSIQWEMVMPGMLTDGVLTKNYTTITKLYKGIKIKKMSRADVAHFLVSEAENQTMIKKYVALTS